MSAIPNIAYLIGNLTEDPRINTVNGVKVANISIAQTGSKRNRDSGEFEDKPTVFSRAAGWRRVAENIEASLHKGDRVIAIAEAKPNSYEKDGVTVNVVEYEILEIAASLEFASVQISRNAKGQGAARPASAPAPQSAPAPAQQAAPAQPAAPVNTAPAAPAYAGGGDDDFT